MFNIIADELNVKKVRVVKVVSAAAGVVVKEEGELKIGLDTAITDELKKEGLVREIVRTINQMRKEQKLTVSDMVSVAYATDDSDLKAAFAEYAEEIKKSVLAAALTEGGDGQEVEIGGRKGKIKITSI